MKQAVRCGVMHSVQAGRQEDGWNETRWGKGRKTD